ncbi:MAG: zinc ABC transporter substrate-binding protein [Tannerellaceae bacterium]|jgi:zinc transport system substrate-binding protein|nr:zinc ABC transporter substrate-binding protein [Tannerellaceae bacterium]
MYTKKLCVWLWLCVLLLCSCVKGKEKELEEELVVSVMIEPQRYFVEAITGGRVKVLVVVPGGQSPEQYDPTAAQIGAIESSRGYLHMGSLGLSQGWSENLVRNNPGLPVFDMSEGMDLMEGDPHIWTSFEGAKQIARNTLKALMKVDTLHRKEYSLNYLKLVDRIRSYQAEARRELSGVCGQAFVIYHPTLTYFAREFGLTQLALEEEGKEPSPKQLRRVIDSAQKLKAKVAFIQEEFDIKNIETVCRETGCRMEVLHPLSGDPMGELVRLPKLLAGDESAD